MNRHVASRLAKIESQHHVRTLPELSLLDDSFDEFYPELLNQFGSRDAIAEAYRKDGDGYTADMLDWLGTLQ